MIIFERLLVAHEKWHMSLFCMNEWLIFLLLAYQNQSQNGTKLYTIFEQDILFVCFPSIRLLDRKA